MAKRVRRPSDPTVAASLDGGRTVAAPLDGGYTVAASLGGGETTAVPSTRPTDKVELAWSTGDVVGGDVVGGDDIIPEAEEPQAAVARQSWSATLRIAGLLVAAGLVLAGVIVLGRGVLTSESSPTKAAPPPGATSAASATAAILTSITSTPDQDNRYIKALNDKGISGFDTKKAIDYGKQVCQDLSRGVKLADEVESFRSANLTDNPSLAAQANDFVNVSIQAYCPQYSR